MRSAGLLATPQNGWCNSSFLPISLTPPVFEVMPVKIFSVWAYSCFSASSAAGNSRSRHGALELGALIIVSTQGFPGQTSKIAFPISAGLCLPGWTCFARLNPLPCLLLSVFVKTWPCNETNPNTLYWDKPGLSGIPQLQPQLRGAGAIPYFSCVHDWSKKDQF